MMGNGLLNIEFKDLSFDFSQDLPKIEFELER